MTSHIKAETGTHLNEGGVDIILICIPPLSLEVLYHLHQRLKLKQIISKVEQKLPVLQCLGLSGQEINSSKTSPGEDMLRRHL